MLLLTLAIFTFCTKKKKKHSYSSTSPKSLRPAKASKSDSPTVTSSGLDKWKKTSGFTIETQTLKGTTTMMGSARSDKKAASLSATQEEDLICPLAVFGPPSKKGAAALVLDTAVNVSPTKTTEPTEVSPVSRTPVQRILTCLPPLPDPDRLSRKSAKSGKVRRKSDVHSRKRSTLTARPALSPAHPIRNLTPPNLSEDGAEQAKMPPQVSAVPCSPKLFSALGLSDKARRKTVLHSRLPTTPAKRLSEPKTTQTTSTETTKPDLETEPVKGAKRNTPPPRRNSNQSPRRSKNAPRAVKKASPLKPTTNHKSGDSEDDESHRRRRPSKHTRSPSRTKKRDADRSHGRRRGDSSHRKKKQHRRRDSDDSSKSRRRRRKTRR